MSVIPPKDEFVDSTPVFPVDYSVFYFNQWKDFDASVALKKHFSPICAEEIFMLKRGDIIWVDEEPYYHRGKVYGYTKRIVTSADLQEDGSFHMTLGYWSYAKFSQAGLGKSIVRVPNERALKNALRDLGPFATRIR